MGLLPSNDLLSHPEDLRARADRDGYLYLKGVLPADQISAARRLIVSQFASSGVCDDNGARAGAPAAWEAIPKEGLVGGLPRELFLRILLMEPLHALPHQTNLLRVWEMIFDEAPLVHPNNMPRVVLPGPTNLPTPPHQDHPFVQGTLSAWTCWLPLGDIPKSLGGLEILKHSHRLGLLPMIDLPENVFAAGVETRELNGQWLGADYESGDALFFHSLTVHRALPNQSDFIRTSIDCRAQPWSHPIQANSLRPYGWSQLSLTWERLYRDWASLAPRYYWRTRALSFSPYDAGMISASLLGERSKEAFEASKNDMRDVL